MSRRIAIAIALFASAASACDESVGGLTARIEFGQAPDTRASDVSRRTLRSAALGPSEPLRLAAVPEFVDRLQVLALDAEGTTLAETNLYASPGPMQLRLFREGGTWTLQGVPAGDDRRLVGRAYLAANADPRLDRVQVFEGEISGVTVVAGQTTDAGVLTLMPGPNRVPEADFDAPEPPANAVATPAAEGERLEVSWMAPANDDVAGYVVAIGDTGAAPILDRSAAVNVGTALDPAMSYEVIAIVDANPTPSVSIDGLEDGTPVNILVYAFDADAVGAPLNYSTAALLFGTPADTSPPGPIEALTAEIDGDSALIRFTAPGEDGAADTTGQPQRYEVRTDNSRDRLLDPSMFGTLASVQAPAVEAPGDQVQFSRPLAALGFVPGTPRYVAVRAVDGAANPGPIAVAAIGVTSSVAPAIEVVEPSIAVAGREVILRGRRFGDAVGEVSLTGTESATQTVPLTVVAWNDTEVLVRVPDAATTGTLSLRRVDDATAQNILTVLSRQDGFLPSDPPPFAFIADGGEGRVAALYRERGFTVEGAIERFVDNAPEGTPWAPVLPGRRSDQIAATKSAERLIFATRNSDGGLDIAMVRTSTTVAADPFRQSTSLGPDPADSLGVAALPTADESVPVLVSLTVQGILRTSVVPDARNGPPNSFIPVTSTVAQFDASAVAVDPSGQGLLAHRTVTGTTARLSLRSSADASTGIFTENEGFGPPSAPAIIVRALPSGDGFVVAYEHIEPDGRTRIRLLDAARYGTTDGVAPFAETDLMLQDIGWVTRNGQTWLAVVAVAVDASAALYFTELPLSALAEPASVGQWPGNIVDVGPDDTRARLGCAFEVASVCAVGWMGESIGVLFVRR